MTFVPPVVTRKIGTPNHAEYAIGAVSEDGKLSLDEERFGRSHIRKVDLQNIIQQEILEAARRLRVYRGSLPPRQWQGKKLIIVDDGLATVCFFQIHSLGAD